VISGSTSLTRLLPAGAHCHDGSRSGQELRCRLAGIEVDYRVVPIGRVLAAYASAVGTRRGTASGAPACARGGEEERSWSRPEAPTRTVGRYACRVEQGHAALWWTVDRLGLLAHATAPRADLASLFTWWEAHPER